jgi:hypothetical protein
MFFGFQAINPLVKKPSAQQAVEDNCSTMFFGFQAINPLVKKAGAQQAVEGNGSSQLLYNVEA